MNIDVSITPINSFYAVVGVLEHQTIKNTLLDYIDSEPADQSNPTISKVDWGNSEHGDRPWLPIIKPVLDNYITIVGTALGYANPAITDLWFQQYTKSNYHDWHIHGQQMVGVYYLELPESTPKTELINPFMNSSKITVDVKEGDILIFPSYIIHRAPEIISNVRKTIFSWNFNYEQPTQQTLNKINAL